MDCPVCRIPMVVIEYRKIELDYCVDCLGVWFDSGEINLLMELTGLDPLQTPLELKPPKDVVIEAGRRCPLCTRKMKKVAPPDQKIILDRCPNGDGIWFDPGELLPVLASISGTSGEVDKTTAALVEFLGSALIDSEKQK